MTAQNPELERAIEEDLDDDARRLVYADWLQQHGDPRGELAIVQHALAAAPTRALAAREAEVRARVVGPLGAILASGTSTYSARYSTGGLDPQWRLGSLDSIRITYWPELSDCLLEERARWPEALALLPDEDDGLDVRGLARLVAGHPAARFLRRLRTGDTTEDYPPIYDHCHAGGPSLLDTIVELAIPTLRVLELGAMDCRQGETELSWIALGDVGKVLRAYPRLREVKLTGACIHHDAGNFRTTPNPMVLELGAIDLPELRRFALRTADLRREQLSSIRYASWPRLESLELWFGSGWRRGADCTVDDVVPLLESPPPALRHLGLENAELTDDLIDPLAASPVLEQLDTLDLSLGCLTDDGARQLRDHEPAFRHLRRLALDRCQLTEAGIALVTGLCAEVSVREQRGPDEPDDNYRYVAVGE